VKTARSIFGVLDDATVLLCGIAAVVAGASITVANSTAWHLGDIPMGLLPDRTGAIGIATAAAGGMALASVGRRWGTDAGRARRRGSTRPEWTSAADPPRLYTPLWVWGAAMWVEGLSGTDAPLLAMYGNSGDGGRHWVALSDRPGSDGQLRPVWGVTHWARLDTPALSADLLRREVTP
jgi:hypothetical protein